MITFKFIYFFSIEVNIFGETSLIIKVILKVRQLLIGGIDILGMVVYEDAAQFKSAISKYKQVILK